MELLQSYDQYRSLISQFRGVKGIISNVYFLPGVLKEEIASKKLYIQSEKNTLFIFQKEKTFYRFYFYTLIDEIGQVCPKCSRPLVAELPFGEVMDVKTKAQRDALILWGFSLGRESGRMSAIPTSLICSKKRDVAISLAINEDVDELYRLLYNTFNPLFSFLPDKEQLKKDIDKGNVLVSRRGNNIQGLLRFDQGKNYVSISQLLVAPENRGMGIARKLLEEFHRKYSDTIRFWHWVDLDNKAAIVLYQKEGYTFDGRHANEYIK